jgi:hypothetical protein
MDGSPEARGWQRTRNFNQDMCPPHAAITIGDRDPIHAPHHPILGINGSACSCGRMLTRTSRPQAVSEAFYRAHLMDLCCELGGSLYPLEAPYACTIPDCYRCTVDNPNQVFSRLRKDTPQ